MNSKPRLLSLNPCVAATRESAAPLRIQKWRRSAEAPLRFGGSSRESFRGTLALAAAAFLAIISLAPAADEFAVTSDSKVQDGVPKGEVIQSVFKGSKIFPGTEHEYWVYVPKQLDAAKPAPVMVFQDGLHTTRRSSSTT